MHFNAGVNSLMDQYPIQGGVEILLVLHVLHHVTETGDNIVVFNLILLYCCTCSLVISGLTTDCM